MNHEMIYLLGKIAVFWFIAVITPGPNFLITMNSSVKYGRCRALLTVMGIVSGTAVWAVSGYFGLNLLFILAPALYMALRIAGACYLVYLGIDKLFRSKVISTGEGYASGSFNCFRKGLAINLTNPKTAIFISSLFATTVPEDLDRYASISAILTILAISFIWYAFVALLFSSRFLAHPFIKMEKTVNGLSGMLYILLGIKILITESSEELSL